jgi:hypothetical protein
MVHLSRISGGLIHSFVELRVVWVGRLANKVAHKLARMVAEINYVKLGFRFHRTLLERWCMRIVLPQFNKVATNSNSPTHKKSTHHCIDYKGLVQMCALCNGRENWCIDMTKRLVSPSTKRSISATQAPESMHVLYGSFSLFGMLFPLFLGFGGDLLIFKTTCKSK